MTAVQLDRPRHGWLPPAHSPVTLDALRHTAMNVVVRHDDPRPRLEKLLRTTYRAHGALLLDSGTHALEVAIRIGRRMHGERSLVALPAYSCFDVATATVATGATIALYDVDPDTLAPDLDSLARAMERGARIVVIAPLYGIPVDWDAIERAASTFGAMLIEDAAQGFGSAWRDKPLGSYGRLSVLSFGRGKGWTGGGGGALLTRSGVTDGWARGHASTSPEARSIAGLARAAAQWVFGRTSLFALAASAPFLHVGETRYHRPVRIRGLSRAAAGMLERSVAEAARHAAIRRANASVLVAGVAAAAAADSQWRIRLIRPPAGATPGYLRFPLRLASGLGGLDDVDAATRLGVRPGYPSALAELPAVRARLKAPDLAHRWSGAETLVAELVTLPTHALVSMRDREDLLQLVDGGRASWHERRTVSSAA